MVWIYLIAGWILGSVVLYAYLVRTAREPARPECMECGEMDCVDCPLLSNKAQESLLKRAA